MGQRTTPSLLTVAAVFRHGRKLTEPWLSTLFLLLRVQNPQPQVQTYAQTAPMMMMMPGGYSQMMPQQSMMMAATTMYQQPYAAYAQQPVAAATAAMNPATDPNHPYAAQWAAYYAAQAQAQTQLATSAPSTAPAAGNFICPWLPWCQHLPVCLVLVGLRPANG